MSAINGYKPFIEEGTGFDEDDLLLCHEVAQTIRPKMLQALDDIPIDGTSTFTVCDYATADGSASMSNIKEIIEILRRKYGESLPIQIIYEDQPQNDYKSLVQRIHGLLPDSDTALIDDENVYVLICSSGFHNKCIAPNTVDLGLSTLSMHYMNTLPCKISGAVHSKQLQVEEEIRMFEEHAAKEWESLLLKRATEMKKGGRFLIDAFATDTKGNYPGSVGCKVNFFANFTTMWKEMLAEGRITQEEFDNSNSLHYLRTTEEYTAPFKDINSPVYKAGLRLVSTEIYYVKCPHQQRWLENGNPGDADAMRKHAKKFVSSVRYWTNWIFLQGLSTRRPMSERQDILDVLFQKYEDGVAKAPADYGFTSVGIVIDFKKV